MDPKKTRPSRRKRRTLVRGEPVVRGILAAVLEELADVGYGALRIEDVAARAGVNKTTVYRRWPTKEELVRATLQSLTVDRFVPPNTGSFRTDLLAIGRHCVQLCTSSEGRSLFQVLSAEGPDSGLQPITRSLREAYEGVARSMLDDVVARGEMAPGVDPTLVADILGAFVKQKVLTEHVPVDEAFLERVVDLLLAGALHVDKRKAPVTRRAVRAKQPGRR